MISNNLDFKSSPRKPEDLSGALLTVSNNLLKPAEVNEVPEMGNIMSILKIQGGEGKSENVRLVTLTLLSKKK